MKPSTTVASLPDAPTALGKPVRRRRGRAGVPSVTPPRRDLFLTVREHEIFTLIADGYPLREIAEQLDIAHATVRTHVNRVMLKAGSHTQAGTIASLIRSGAIV